MSAVVPLPDIAPLPVGTGVTRFAMMVPELVPLVIAQIEADLPALRDAPWRDRAADEAFLHLCLARHLEPSGRGGAPEDDLGAFAEHFRSFVRRGAPLRAVQEFHRAAVAYSFTELWARAEPEDLGELLRLSRRSSRRNAGLERMLVQVYRESLDRPHQGADPRTARVERLLMGLAEEAPPGLRARSLQYLVVALAGHERIDAEPPFDALCAVVDQVRHVLVPLDARGRREAVWQSARAWIGAHPGVHAAGAFADGPTDVPVAAASARRLLGVAVAVGSARGLVAERDLLLELALAEDPDGLADVLAPIRSDERLLRTLSCFFANDLDRARTAEDLGVSRRGFYLRLDRITRATGLDPRSTRGIRVLSAALTAEALRRSAPLAGPPAAG